MLTAGYLSFQIALHVDSGTVPLTADNTIARDRATISASGTTVPSSGDEPAPRTSVACMTIIVPKSNCTVGVPNNVTL